MIAQGIFRIKSSVAAILAASLMAPVLASAEAEAEAQPGRGSEPIGLEEVTVTARRTSETLQTTPVAVTALSEAALRQQQVLQVDDLPHAAPDMAVGGAGTGPSSIVYLAIRGEAQNSPNSASDNAVGIYQDGVYYARPIIGNLGFLDVRSVEVLRGPQGTLFGRNTTGGALNVTTNQPTGKFEGYIQGGFGNYSERRGEGVLNVPLLGEELAVRVAARYTSHDSYFRNPITGINPGELKHDDSGRATVRWAPSSLPLTLSIAADVTDQRDTGTPTALVGYNATGQPFFPLIPLVTGQNPANYLVNDSNFYQTFGNPRTPDREQNVSFNKNKAKGIAANLDVDFSGVHLKSITAYRDSDTGDAVDLDGTPVRFGSFVSQYIQHQASEEVQLSGKAGKFDLIGGLFYFTEGGSERSQSQIFGLLTDINLFKLLGIAPSTPEQPIRQDFANFTAKSSAAFFQTNYHITDAVRVTAGYRYTRDTRDLNRHGRQDILRTNVCEVGATTGNPPGQPCEDPHSAKFTYPAYTFGVDWQALDSLFLYVKTSRASMAGGFNTRPVPSTVSSSFAPETNKDVEFGLKSDAFERHLRTNLAIFYSKQDQVQNIVNTVIPSPTGGPGTLTQYVANAGKARKYGVELEVTAIPWQDMEVRMTGAYLHSAYAAGSFSETQLVNGRPVVVDRSGEPVPQAPKYTFSLGATQSVPVSFGTLAFRADYSYRASVVYTWDTPAPGRPDTAAWNIANRLGVIPAYGLLNGRVSLEMNQPNVEIALWGRNLTEKHTYTQQFDSYTGLGTAINFQGDPRSYGATINYKF